MASHLVLLKSQCCALQQRDGIAYTDLKKKSGKFSQEKSCLWLWKSYQNNPPQVNSTCHIKKYILMRAFKTTIIGLNRVQPSDDSFEYREPKCSQTEKGMGMLLKI